MNVAYTSVRSSALSLAMFAPPQAFDFTHKTWPQLGHVIMRQHANLEFSSSGLWAWALTSQHGKDKLCISVMKEEKNIPR